MVFLFPCLDVSLCWYSIFSYLIFDNSVVSGCRRIGCWNAAGTPWSGGMDMSVRGIGDPVWTLIHISYINFDISNRGQQMQGNWDNLASCFLRLRISFMRLCFIFWNYNNCNLSLNSTYLYPFCIVFWDRSGNGFHHFDLSVFPDLSPALATTVWLYWLDYIPIKGIASLPLPTILPWSPIHL